MLANLFKFVTSLRLTLFLLFALTLTAIGGSGVPEQPGHYEVYFQSPWYRGLLALLAINLLFCSGKTIARNLRDRSRYSTTLVAAPQMLALPTGLDLDRLGMELRRAGYRVQRLENTLIAERGRLARWGSTLVHAAVLLVMLGAVLGSLGFVGTMNTYLGSVNSRYFDWTTQQEQPLGFALRADAVNPEYYPISLRFSVTEAGGLAPLGTVETGTGETFQFPNSRLEGKVRSFDPDRGLLSVELQDAGQVLGVYQISATDQSFTGEAAPFAISEVDYRAPQLRQIATDVSILEAGRVVKQGTIRVNHPLTHRGVAIYQIAFQYHPDGRWSVGFQLSRDPGEVLVWAGSLLLVVGLLIAFLLPYRAVGITADGEEGFGLAGLSGFPGERGQSSLTRLRESLQQPPQG